MFHKRRCGKVVEITPSLYIYVCLYVEITTYNGGAASNFCFIPMYVHNSLVHPRSGRVSSLVVRWGRVLLFTSQ